MFMTKTIPNLPKIMAALAVCAFAFGTAEKIVKAWAKEGHVEKVGMHELLLVYRKK